MTASNQDAPKAIHLPCLLEVGHAFYRGNTCELSEHVATVQIPALIFPGMKKPRHGESAMLSFDLHESRELRRETLKIPCKVSYIATIIVGLIVDRLFMSEEQHKTYEAVLELET